MPSSLRRSMMFPVVVVTALVIGLAGCSSADPDPSSPSSAANSESGPVTIGHKFGTATIDGPVDRVVTIGFDEQDFTIALGVEPVAVREFLG